MINSVLEEFQPPHSVEPLICVDLVWDKRKSMLLRQCLFKYPFVSLAHTCCLFRYQSPKDPTQVEYMRFSDEIESIFTRKDLEKTPTAEVVQFVPPVGVNMYVLSPEEEQTLQKTMHRLAERVRTWFYCTYGASG